MTLRRNILLWMSAVLTLALIGMSAGVYVLCQRSVAVPEEASVHMLMCYFIGASLIIGVALMAVACGLLQRLALKPINRLSEQVVRLGRSGDLVTRIVPTGSVEIDKLTEAINDMRIGLHQNQQSLRLNEERYRAVVEDQTELICRFKAGGTLTFVNEAYCRYFNQSRTQLIGSSFMPLIFEDDQQRLKECLATISVQQPWITVEHRVILPSGEIHWMQWVNRAIFDANSAIIEYQAVGSDITERKRAEKALRESEEKYRLLVENANEAIVVVQDGRLKFANRMAVELTGYSEQELTSRPFPEFIHPDDRGIVVERHLRRLKGNGAQPRYTFRSLTRDGSVKWVEISAVLIDWEGKPATLNFLSNITERKRAEEQFQASLAEKELLLEEIHHRVKNNLQIISSLLNLQAGFIQDPRTLELFRECQNRIQSMALIHEGLYQPDNLALINVGNYMRHLIADVYQSYGVTSADIGLSVEVDSGIKLSMESAIPCGLIVNELISNALKHAFPPAIGAPGGMETNITGRGEIRVSLKSDGKDHLLLEVADTGVGLSPDFDPGQLKSLGLRLVKMLAAQLQGVVVFDRSGGTTCRIRFPIYTV